MILTPEETLVQPQMFIKLRAELSDRNASDELIFPTTRLLRHSWGYFSFHGARGGI